MSRRTYYSAALIVPLLILTILLFSQTPTDAAPRKNKVAERIQFHIDAELADGQSNAFLSFDIPEGKRLLIDHITADVQLPLGQRAYIQLGCQPALNPPTSGLLAHHIFPVTPQGANISTGPGFETHVLAQVTNLFCDKELSIILARGPAPSPPGEGSGRIAISGRLVDQPKR